MKRYIYSVGVYILLLPFYLFCEEIYTVEKYLEIVEAQNPLLKSMREEKNAFYK